MIRQHKKSPRGAEKPQRREVSGPGQGLIARMRNYYFYKENAGGGMYAYTYIMSVDRPFLQKFVLQLFVKLRTKMQIAHFCLLFYVKNA